MPITKLKNGQLPDTISSKTVDNTNDINTTTTRLKITGGSNGQVLSTDGSGNLSWATAGGGGGAGVLLAVVKKTVTETVTSSTTLQDDDELTYTVPIETPRNYYVIFNILWGRTNTSASISPRVNVFAGSGTFRRLSTNVLATTDGSANYTTEAIALGLTGNLGPYIDPLISLSKSNAFTSTTFRLQWAQVTSSTTGLRVLKGSYMEIYDLGEA